MLDLGELRSGFRKDLARYEKLTVFVQSRLGKGAREAGIVSSIEGRAKGEPNFVRKAIKKFSQDPVKYADPLVAIHDRAGVKAIVLHQGDVAAIRALVEDLFEVIEFEDTRDRYAANEIGYLGVHYLVLVPVPALAHDERDLEGLICEIQIHTKAQDAWSTVSHSLLYKPVGEPIPKEIASRVNRAVVLIDLFDDEVTRARRDLASTPGYLPARLLDVLQAEFLRMSPRDFDPELSLGVLDVVREAYSPEELERFPEVVGDFMATRRATIEALFEHYSDDPGVHPLLFQPETITIFERLAAGPHNLRAVWVADGRYDVELLDSLRNVLGL